MNKLKMPVIVMASIFLLASMATAVATIKFRDVLEQPSAKSRLAAKSLLIGVTMAGTRIVGVGQHGHIVYSDDQGKKWNQANVPVSCDLVSVYFPTPQKGWAVGHDGVVLHSSDSGATWVKQFDGLAAAQLLMDTYSGNSASPSDKVVDNSAMSMADEVKSFVSQGADKPFLDVYFENETSGFIVGAFNMIFHTTDGGKSWTPWYDRIDNPKRYHLYSIRSIGQDKYITAEQGAIFKLDQQTGRFKAIKTPYNGTFFGITGKPGALIAFGMRGNAFRSRDDGSSWQKTETSVQSGLVGGTVSEDGRVILVSQGGHVLVSGDDGESFTQVKTGQAIPMSSIAVIDKSTVAMVGPLGVNVQSIK